MQHPFPESRPVFHTNDPRRWKRFRTAAVATALLSSILFVGLVTYLVTTPALTKPRFFRTSNGSDTTSRTLYVPAESTRARHEHYQRILQGKSPVKSERIHAAFYVSWDISSFESLRSHLTSINTLFTEWAWLRPPEAVGKSVIRYAPDSNVIKLLRSAPKVGVHCMISNYDASTNRWRGDAITAWLSSATKRESLAKNIAIFAAKNHFAGINIDFEDVPSRMHSSLIDFLDKLHRKLQKTEIILSVDAPADNPEFDLGTYAATCDYLVLMAYDEHNGYSVPGPISPYNWFVAQVKSAAAQVPAQKLIIGIAAYGYDWATAKSGQTIAGDEVSFQQAAVTAVESDTIPVYDTISGSLHYGYEETDGSHHEIWLNDAVAAYNQIRLLNQTAIAGTALWRLGSEDPSIWDFYGKSEVGRAQFIPLLKRIHPSTDPEYEGEGEVLSLIAEPRDGSREFRYDRYVDFIRSENLVSLPSSYIIQKFGLDAKRVVLSFDDGPDPSWTPKILDVLAHKHAPAVFFVVGENSEANFPLLKREFREGHEIGNHSFSHPDISKISLERTERELSSTERIIEAATLSKPVIFRAPYVADAEPSSAAEIEPVARSSRLGYLTVESAIDPQDWHTPKSPQEIIDTCLSQLRLGSIILLHDAGGDRSATLAALPLLIDSLRARGYEIVSLSSFLHLPKSLLMPTLTGAERSQAQLENIEFLGLFGLQVLLADLFFLAIIVSIARLLVIAFFAFRQRRRSFRARIISSKSGPMVSILVPAFNEGLVLVRTIRSLLASDYKNCEVIVIDDGSSDDTYRVAAEHFGTEPAVCLLTKPNGGKASALNFGIAQSKGEIIIVIDADTIFEPTAISELVKYFQNDATVGAVAGNVKVGNAHNILTKWQAIEYVTSQNFDRRAFEELQAITVVPGAIGAFRRTALEEVGGYRTDTLAEDTDLTIRIERKGWRVVYAEAARAWTEAPETIKQFAKQRFRWTFGTMQVLWKNRRAIFNPKAGSVGMIALPNILIFQFLIPLLAPLVDVLFVVSLLNGNSSVTFVSYIVFLLIDLGGSLVAFSMEGERKAIIFWLPLQRFFYRQLMYYVLYRSVLAALRGQLQGWGKLQRTGSVEVRTQQT